MGLSECIDKWKSRVIEYPYLDWSSVCSYQDWFICSHQRSLQYFWNNVLSSFICMSTYGVSQNEKSILLLYIADDPSVCSKTVAKRLLNKTDSSK